MGKAYQRSSYNESWGGIEGGVPSQRKVISKAAADTGTVRANLDGARLVKPTLPGWRKCVEKVVIRAENHLPLLLPKLPLNGDPSSYAPPYPAPKAAFPRQLPAKEPESGPELELRLQEVAIAEGKGFPWCGQLEGCVLHGKESPEGTLWGAPPFPMYANAEAKSSTPAIGGTAPLVLNCLECGNAGNGEQLSANAQKVGRCLDR